MKKIIKLIVFCLALSTNFLAQEKEITSDEYWSAISIADKKFQETPSRRVIFKEEFYRDGKTTGKMETVRENIKPDKVRYLVTEVSSKQTTKTELIQIGASNFCRINDGEWINSKGACRGGWITSVPDAVSSQYFVETVNDKGKTARIYRAYNLYKISDSGGKESMTYEETKFWISEVGNFLRRETIYALKDTKQIRSKEIRTYEYDPKDLKIEAPIKQ